MVIQYFKQTLEFTKEDVYKLEDSIITSSHKGFFSTFTPLANSLNIIYTKLSKTYLMFIESKNSYVSELWSYIFINNHIYLALILG